MKVLFVCTGNICRSPVAEKLLERHSTERGLGLRVSSAGTRALNGQPMHPESQRVLQERGVDPGDFESRMLTPDIAADCDLLLGMTREHRAIARQLAPARWKRMFAIREIATGTASRSSLGPRAVNPTDVELDIRDPIGESPQIFDEVAGEIAALIPEIVYWITSQEVVAHGKQHSAD